MSLNSHWFQKYEPPKLKKRKKSVLVRKFFNFDDLYFWNHWEFRDIMYLILKVYSVVNWSQQLKGVTALLFSSTPF